MKIDHKSFLFTELSETERKELFSEVEKYVLEGRFLVPSKYFDFWIKELGLQDTKNFRHILAEHFALRSLLSIIKLERTIWEK